MKVSILIFIFLYFIVSFIILKFQGRMIFFPGSGPLDQCFLKSSWKAEIILKDFKQHKLQIIRTKKKENLGTVIHFHGNAGSVCDRTFLLDKLDLNSFNMVLVEYPGYSDNHEELSENNFKIYGLNVIHYLLEEGYLEKEQPVIFFGESLGCATASFLASSKEVQTLPFRIAGLILQSPFYQLKDLVYLHYPFLIPFLPFVKYNFPVAEWARQVPVKTFIGLAEKDEIVPVKNSLKLKNSFQLQPEVHIYQNRHHNDLVFDNKYWQDISDYIGQQLHQ